jgi:plasmid maintenance system antidote protein VapI
MDGKQLLAKYVLDSGKQQAAIAAEIGCSEGHLSAILSGTRGTSPKMAKRISEVTGIPFEALLLERSRQEEAA